MPDRRPRVLCVDDEPRVLEGLTLNLRKRLDVVTAESGEQALAVLADPAPLQVIISDMRMPGMDGAAFLARARALKPDAVRIVLTGQTDIESAMRAVNDGQIFRFLTKPCPPELLLRTVSDGIRQYHLVTAERELLDRTLRGCVRALTEILTLTNPEAFGRATRIKRIVVELCAALEIADVWAIEVAAMVSQLGLIIVPNHVAQRIADGRPVDASDRAMLDKVPAVTRQILVNIPRLEPVLEILELAAQGPGGDTQGGGYVPVYPLAPKGAAILRLATHYDALDDGRMSRAAIVATLRSRTGEHESHLLDALMPTGPAAVAEPEVRPLLLADLRPGMVLATDIKATSGTLLAARGHELTAGGLERLHNFARSGGVVQPILVTEPHRPEKTAADKRAVHG